MTIGEKDKKPYKTWKLALTTIAQWIEQTTKNWFMSSLFYSLRRCNTSHHKQIDILAIRIKKMDQKKDVKFTEKKRGDKGC